MKKHILTLIMIIAAGLTLQGQAPRIIWEHTFGGANNDEAFDIINTNDGGFAICGMTESKGAGGKDAWVIKLDPQGKVEWEKTYGEKKDEVANAIIQTSDNGYAFVGYTDSKGKGKRDILFIKLDSSGNKQWEGIYGGSKHDEGYDLVQTYDGNYAIAGATKSFGGGSYDMWIIKIDSKGGRIWRKTDGGRGADIGISIEERAVDSSLVVAGTTFSNALGQSDLWLIKYWKDGKRDWRKKYGSINKDEVNHLLIKSTGEYIISGSTQAKGERYGDFWVVGFTPESWDDWEQSYGTTKDEAATCATETTDKSTVVCGYTNSYGEGGYDFWLMKFDNKGKQLWQETYGSFGDEQARAIKATDNNEMVVVGSTTSDGEGKKDIWIIYLK